MSIIEKTEPTTALTRTGMSPVVAAVLAHNPDAATLREVLSLQREYEANEARKAYSSAIVNLKRDLPTVLRRDKLVNFGTTRYTHTSLAEVMDKITGPVTMHGFSLTWHPSTKDGQVSVTCRLTHADGHFEEVTISAPIDNKGSKSPAQGVASTMTLLQRYTALALLGIATTDMDEPRGDDGEHQEGAHPAPDRVDSQRNLKAVSWLIAQGRKPEDAEAHVKRKVSDWTAADLDELKKWAKSPAPATERDPGEDDDR